MSYVQHSERTLHTWTRRRSGGSDLCVLAHLITHAFFGYIESGEYATQQDINIVLDRNLVCLQATDLLETLELAVLRVSSFLNDISTTQTTCCG